MSAPALQPPDFRAFSAELRARACSWTQGAVFAREWPAGMALISARGGRRFDQLHGNANRLAHHLRASGLGPGDAVALMCSNRPEFVEVLLAALRVGLRLTPISTQLTPAEVAYIVRDCQARLFFVEAPESAAELAEMQQIVIGSAHYSQVLEMSSPTDLLDSVAGSLMLYTSGTTGRPKGVYRRTPEWVEPQFEGSFADYRPGDVQLCAGPAYHAAPLLFDLRWPLASGVPIVLMEQWDTADVLATLARHRVSHAHMVPTMFQRLLAVPAEDRARHDLSALRMVLHGAAPCPVPVKRALIGWWGPVLTEYYAATEGGDNVHVNSVDWLRKPGTVGRLEAVQGHRILDDNGEEVPQGKVGRIYFRAPDEGRFEYFGDPDKTSAAYRDGRFTLGDLGYVDDDGWLFLTGRSADTIISGGVNIYPREVDEVLASHPAVAQACTVGAPDDDWGERVVSVVVPVPGATAGDGLAAQLLVYAGQRLARYKCPRDIVFDTGLPQTATGKLLRGQVRQRFWQASGKDI